MNILSAFQAISFISPKTDPFIPLSCGFNILEYCILFIMLIIAKPTYFVNASVANYYSKSICFSVVE